MAYKINDRVIKCDEVQSWKDYLLSLIYSPTTKYVLQEKICKSLTDIKQYSNSNNYRFKKLNSEFLFSNDKKKSTYLEYDAQEYNKFKTFFDESSSKVYQLNDYVESKGYNLVHIVGLTEQTSNMLKTLRNYTHYSEYRTKKINNLFAKSEAKGRVNDLTDLPIYASLEAKEFSEKLKQAIQDVEIMHISLTTIGSLLEPLDSPLN
jgi:hypothetical protein